MNKWKKINKYKHRLKIGELPLYLYLIKHREKGEPDFYAISLLTSGSFRDEFTEESDMVDLLNLVLGEELSSKSLKELKQLALIETLKFMKQGEQIIIDILDGNNSS